MNTFERIAQHFGCTFNAYIARNETLKYIPESYIIVGLLILTVIITGAIMLIRNRKNKL